MWTKKKKTYQVGNTIRYFPRADMFAVLGAGQDPTEHLHHHSQTVAFISSWNQQTQNDMNVMKWVNIYRKNMCSV